jgi:putative membrane protein
MRRVVWSAAAAIPVVVALLYVLPAPGDLSAETQRQLFLLPRLNALLNGSAFVCLVAAYIAVRSKRIALHRRLTTTAVLLSVLFLLSYVAFHATTESTRFGGTGSVRTVYFVILLSHIVLSAVIVPLVLFTWVRGFRMEVEKHRRIARWTWPLWLYVTATGVIVYFMISPYYPA